jgi:hypothetical protein
MVTAREKLNGAFINGALFFGLVAGAATGSFLVGFLVFGVLLGIMTHSGDIRLRPNSLKPNHWK